MKRIEYITAENAKRVTEIGPALGETYKIAFAGPPWYEVSRCQNQECIEEFSSLIPGAACTGCSSDLVEAYDATELTAMWRQMVEEDEACMEVAFDGDYPQRATLARPTAADELWQRKYSAVPAMRNWLDKRFGDDKFVWIEDTFADRSRQPTGNLKDRRETLERVAAFYKDLQIATRTLSPAIVAATVRAKPAATAVYLGTERVGGDIVNEAFSNPGYSLPEVPDMRTLLIVGRAARRVR